MKKNLQLAVLALALCCVTVNAQNAKVGSKQPLPNNNQTHTHQAPTRLCGTEIPHGEWENWTDEQIAEFEKKSPNNFANNGKQMIQYTIPVVVHVIHSGVPAGTGNNISAAQIQDQINILNADMLGTGLNSSLTPSYFAGLKANCEITFCLATKNPTGGILTEPGIDRVSASSIGVSTGALTQGVIDGTVKPATIWDPTRYCNMWVCSLSGGLLGYATFPVGTGLSCLSAGETASNSGVVMGHNFFGSIGTAAASAPYHKGRTTTHEIGHWLGLRHINGDGNCTASDCVADTPPQEALHGGCPSSASPYHVANCPGNSPNGEMFMNFMDYTDDLCMYMFTTAQKARIQQTMANGTYRNMLNASSATLCVLSATAPTASISIASTGCATTAISTTNMSSGVPTPTYLWSTNPGGATFNPNNTATAPTITFPSANVYTVTCVATNSLGNSSNSKVITITTCSAPAIACNDTLTNFKNTDTLFSIRSNTAQPGYVAGNNGYGDIEKAEYYSPTGIPVGTKVMGGIALFYRHATANIGTKGTSTLQFRMYNGTNVTGGGPSGAAVQTHTNTINGILASSTATAGVTYCGNPGLAFTSNIIRPYSYNFPVAQTIAGGFLMSVTLPTVTGDTATVFMTSGSTATASTAWEKWSDNSWNQFNDGTSNSWQLNSSIAILPKLSCPTEIFNPNGISGNIAIFPNPSNGHFNFAITMPTVSDLNFTVVNSIGQVVLTKVEKSVTSAIVGLDLSHLSKGIYFVNIIDSTGDKTTKKLIIE